MRHRVPIALYLTGDAMKDIFASNRGAIVDGTMGFALVYGKRRPRLTVTLLLADGDSPRQRREKRRRIRDERLVLLGESRAVTETTVHRKNGHRYSFSVPPVGYVYFLRHRIGRYNQLYAATYDGASATQLLVRRAKKRSPKS